MSARCRVHRASTSSVLCCTSVRRVLCCSSARRRVHRASTSGTPCFTTEHVPTAAYAAPATVIEYVAPAGTCAAPAPAYVTETWGDADMSESMSEMSEDAAVNVDGLLDTVFDAMCELAVEDGRDWVPVRQIQVRTSLRLERLEELLEEWECMGVVCRDVTRLEVAFCMSVAAQIEKCRQT